MDDFAKEKFLQICKHFKLKNYLDYFREMENNIKSLKQAQQEQVFDIDFIDDDGLSPLHYSCQLNHIECSEILLLENGASIDLSCESGFRPRDLLQHDEIKRIFQEFYRKVDKAINDVELFRDSTNFKDIKNNIMKLQFSSNFNDKELDLSEEEIDISEEQLKKEQVLVSRVCYKNLINFYHKRYPNVVEEITEIIKHRKWLPEISQYAM